MAETSSGTVHGELTGRYSDCTIIITLHAAGYRGTSFILCCASLTSCTLVFCFPPGQRRWSGTARARRATGKQTTTAKHGERATAPWAAWPPRCRAAASCSRAPAAAPAPTSSCASRTPSHHTPRNKSLHAAILPSTHPPLFVLSLIVPGPSSTVWNPWCGAVWTCGVWWTGLWLFAWQRRFVCPTPPKRQRQGSNRGVLVL